MHPGWFADKELRLPRSRVFGGYTRTWLMVIWLDDGVSVAAVPVDSRRWAAVHSHDRGAATSTGRIGRPNSLSLAQPDRRLSTSFKAAGRGNFRIRCSNSQAIYYMLVSLVGGRLSVDHLLRSI